MNTLDLSRFQFGLTSSFHYIYPPLSIGLGLMLVILEGAYLKTKDPKLKELVRFWVKVFSLTFALGVATGIVQLFSFGTNWARFSRYTGDVFGSALGAEGIFAFFLEAGFLGVVLFGWDRVSRSMHYFSTIMVAAGAHFSAFWIVIANSWMQTPAGYKLVGTGDETKAVVTHFWEMMFNPSVHDRVLHVILGCWLAGSFLVISISAYYLLKRRHLEFARTSMAVGLWVSILTLIAQLYSGDTTARGVAYNQPSKFAALEGVYHTRMDTPITVLGWADNKAQRVYGLRIPYALSYMVYYKSQAIKGLDQIPKEDWPNVPAVFQTYHLMVLSWGLMCLCCIAALFFRYRGTLERRRWLLRSCVASVFLPQLANQAGWFTAEMGRQPWVVYGLLRTKDAVSTNIRAGQVAGSIAMYLAIYSLLLVLFLYLLNHKIQEGPAAVGQPELEREPLYRDPLG